MNALQRALGGFLVLFAVAACSSHVEREPTGEVKQASHDAVYNEHNCVFIGKSYVTSTSYTRAAYFDDPGTMLSTFYDDEKVDCLLVNVGVLTTDGIDAGGIADLDGMQAMLEDVAAWESANSKTFEVWAWVNSPPDSTMNIQTSSVRASVVDSVNTILGTSATHQFDGVLIDFEPQGCHTSNCANAHGGDGSLVSNSQLMLADLRSGMTRGKLGITPPKFNDTVDNGFWWTKDDYNDAAQNADMIVAQTYDTSSTCTVSPDPCSPTGYQSWMRSEVTTILQSVAGLYSGQTSPPRHVDVLFGFPAIPPSNPHNPSYENASTAGGGVKDGIWYLQNLYSQSVQDATLPLLRGGAMYIQTTAHCCTWASPTFCDSLYGEHLWNAYPDCYASFEVNDDWGSWSAIWLTQTSW